MRIAQEIRNIITAFILLGSVFSDPSYSSFSAPNYCPDKYNQLNPLLCTPQNTVSSKYLKSPGLFLKGNEAPKAMLPIDLPGIFTNPSQPMPLVPNNLPKEVVPEPGG